MIDTFYLFDNLRPCSDPQGLPVRGSGRKNLYRDDVNGSTTSKIYSFTFISNTIFKIYYKTTDQ